MAEKTRIVVCVSNDLSTDQRVHKMCLFLEQQGADVLLIGRKLPGSVKVKRSYTTKRFKMLFTSGPLFYGFFNLRLFLFLLFSGCDVIVANDLDTLWAASKAKRFKKARVLVYDSHELFTEVPELQHSPRKKKIWERIEKNNIKKANAWITVNRSIAQWYQVKYGITMAVVRNMPMRAKTTEQAQENTANGLAATVAAGERVRETDRPKDYNPQKKYLIIQGAGINVDRGNEEMLEAMKQLPDYFHLWIIGNGDVVPQLKKNTTEWKLDEKITFHPRMPFENLMQYTRNAWLGITLDKDTNLNYRYSLPNKLFDFIQAGCPVLASNLPEVNAVIETHQVGILTPSHSPSDIAQTILQLDADSWKYNQLKKNVAKAADVLCWENEIPVLEKIYLPYLRAQR